MTTVAGNRRRLPKGAALATGWMMRAVALLLAVILSPGVAEVTEDFAHWVSQGHTVHASAEQHAEHAATEPPGGDNHATDEHGCSALFHLCGCHSPAPSMVSARIALDWADASLVEPTSAFPYSTLRAPDGVNGESFRPPIV